MFNGWLGNKRSAKLAAAAGVVETGFRCLDAIRREPELRTLTIPTSADEPYVAGATLFGILARPPNAPTDRKFQPAVDALCHQVLMRQFAAEPDLARAPRVVTPAYLMLPTPQLVRLQAEIPKRLQERMAAAHAAMPFFQEAERLAAGGQPAKRRRKSIDQQAARVIAAELERSEWLQASGHTIDRSCPADESNFESRLIRPSLPVLHIAAAVAIVMDLCDKELRAMPAKVQDGFPRDMKGPQVSLEIFLEQPELVALVVVKSRPTSALTQSWCNQGGRWSAF